LSVVKFPSSLVSFITSLPIICSLITSSYFFILKALISPVGSKPCLLKCVPKNPTPACANVDNGV